MDAPNNAPTMTNTNITAAEDYMLRSLYAAKAEFKDASSELATAEHNLEAIQADPASSYDDRVNASSVRFHAEARYLAAEKTYNIISKAAQRMALI